MLQKINITQNTMFFTELGKYAGSRRDAIVEMYDDLGMEAFQLLLEAIGNSKLKKVLNLIPESRTDIYAIIMQTGVL